MATREEVYERIRQSFKELFELDESRITPETKLVDDLGLDSIDALDLAAHLEELTPHRIPDERLKEMRTVQDVVDLAFELVNKGSPDGSPSE